MEMMSTPQVMEMLRELQQQELDRMSVHRIEALAQREGLRRTVASALVRLGMTLDHGAGAQAMSARTRQPRTYSSGPDTALHW
jgi:hypothetical protein